LLRRYASKLSPNAFYQIKKAHNNKDVWCWWYQWLASVVLKKSKWVYIATRRAISD
jgi:hypothetical protein